MRKFPLLALSIMLVACGGSGGGVACVSQYWNGTVGTCLPEGWEVLGQDTLDRYGIPDETVVAFQNKTARDGQFDTVTVTKEQLVQDLSSAQYSEANIQSVSTLPDYAIIDQEGLSVDSQDTAMHIFSARPVADKPIRRYYQVSFVANGVGYTFTGSLPLSVEGDAENAIRLILQNATAQLQESEE